MTFVNERMKKINNWYLIDLSKELTYVAYISFKVKLFALYFNTGHIVSTIDCSQGADIK